MEKVMRLKQRTLAAVLVLLASAAASAEGLEWVGRDARGTLVVGGGSDAVALHVCRASLGNDVVVPGKFWTAGDRGGECRIAAGGAELAIAAYEMLVETSNEAAWRWVPGHATGYPQRSVVGGRGADGQRLLVCAGIDAADGSVHPGYIQDDNCLYANGGKQVTAESYLVLVTNDAAVPTTLEAQPASEGFDPQAILGGKGVAALCAAKEGACVASLPEGF
jgi:hypothetical protein